MKMGFRSNFRLLNGNQDQKNVLLPLRLLNKCLHLKTPQNVRGKGTYQNGPRNFIGEQNHPLQSFIILRGQVNKFLPKHKKSHYFGLAYFYFPTYSSRGSIHCPAIF